VKKGEEQLGRYIHPVLYQYALRYFGNRKKAVRAARNNSDPIHFKHRTMRPRERKSNLDIANDIQFGSSRIRSTSANFEHDPN